MQLTQKNLEAHSWLFSASLRLMVREHECSRPHRGWDVEMDSYTNQNTSDDPRWENDQEVFDCAADVDMLVKAHPELTKTADWVSGNKVEFF